MFDDAKNKAVAAKWNTHERMRWMDLSAAGMHLYLAVYKKGRRLVIENGDKMPEAMKKLGFERADNGYWFRLDFTYNPNDIKAAIPNAVTRRDMPISEIILDLTEAEPVNDATATTGNEAALAKMTQEFEDTAPTFLGLNRAGDEIYQKSNGVRHLVNKKRTTSEDKGAATVPAHYLRAPDSNQLSGCAEGYIVTLEVAPAAEFSRPDVFMKTALELDPFKDRARFAAAVSAAAVRHITKDNKETLTSRYERAARLSSLFSQVGLDIGVNLESVLLTRRLLGTDKDLRGEALYRIGGVEDLFEKVLPSTGCRHAESPEDASILVNFAKTPEELANTLDSRPAKSKTILVLDVDSHRKARAIADAVAENNHIEGAAFISKAAGGPRLVLSVICTEQKSGDFVLQEVGSTAEAWTWASMVAKERTHAIETFKAGLATDNDFNSASAFVFDNSYQIPYSSASKVGKPTSLVPKELSAATRVALDRIISNYRDIDEKVANECGYSKEELGRYLAPEQVDGVALLINAEERARGAVIGDGTGVGKGRQLMAMVRRAVLKGQRALIFSESAANLADLMRDAKHLDSLDLIKPLVVNNDKLIDEVTKEEYPTLDRSILDKAVAEGVWPEDAKVIMATYSQFNREAEDSPKSAWLRAIVDERVSLFGDEIHNAASLDSNVSVNYSYIKQKAALGIISASATYAKEAKNIAFFKEMFPSDIDMPELQAMMIKGGEPFQEVVSDMLTADGVFFRRETDLSEIEFVQLLDSEKIAENRDIADKMSIIVSEMAQIAESVSGAVDIINRRNGQERGGNAFRKLAIGSSLYHITRLLNAALVAPFTADRAIEELKAGNKPGFLLENTVGELLEEARQGDGSQPTFRHVLHRALNQMMGSGQNDISAEVLDILATQFPEARENYDNIVRLINDFPEIPASVIDTIKNRITAAGYTIGEITGRSLEVNPDGKVVPRKERDKQKVKNGFNAGEYDCVIMNATGATGMDLHAGRRFKDRRRRVLFEVQGPANVLKQIQAYGRYSRRDQESAPKIAFVGTGLPFESRLAAMRNQKLRRLSANVQSNRDNSFLMGNIPDLINQVGDAVITKYAELRPDLLRRLVLTEKYANRTKLMDVANETSGFKVEPETATELAVVEDEPRQQVGRGRPGTELIEQRSANEFLSRLSLLPCREQDRILHELTAEYEMHIAELDSLGVNPLRPREFDGTVQVRNSKLFEGSIETGANSAFEAPMYLMEAMVEREVEPMRSDVVVEALEESTPRYDKILSAVNEVVRNRERYLSHYLQDGHASVDDAIARGDTKIASMAKDIAHLKLAIDAFQPGRQINFVNADGVSEKAIIASVEAPWSGSEHLIASYRMKIAIPGTEKLKEYGVETVMRNNGVSSFDKDGQLKIATTDGLLGNDYERILESFDKAQRKKLQPASFLVGNVFRAVRYATQFRLGSLVSFVDEKGFRHRGVLINKQAEKRLQQIAVRVEGIEAATKALAMDIEINSSPTGTGRNLVITPLNNGTYAVRLPEPYVRRNVKQWPSDGYRELYETMVAPDFDHDSENAKTMSKAKLKQAVVPRAIISARQLDSVLQVVSQAGFNTFYVAPVHRDKVSEPEDKDAQWTPEANGVKL